jgi:hypothetical protein
MAPPAPARRDPVEAFAKALASPVLNAIVGIIGIALPVLAWVNDKASVKNALFAAETLVVILLVLNHLWLHRSFIQLRRANNRAMSDAHFFDLVRSQLERELIADFGEIADGHLQVYASEVPRLSVLLLKTLVDSQTQPKRVLAADLTTNPNLLTQRREYLAANRRLIEAGGTVDRLFICFAADLVREDYARALLQLINHHRSLGVTCGLAIRDRLPKDQAVDVVVIASAAALVEEEQSDADYTSGRSSVYFTGVADWVRGFEFAWTQGDRSASGALMAYQALAGTMLDAGTWDVEQAAVGVARL